MPKLNTIPLTLSISGIAAILSPIRSSRALELGVGDIGLADDYLYIGTSRDSGHPLNAPFTTASSVMMVPTIMAITDTVRRVRVVR